MLALVNTWGKQATATGDTAELDSDAEDAPMDDDAVPQKYVNQPEQMQTDS